MKIADMFYSPRSIAIPAPLPGMNQGLGELLGRLQIAGMPRMSIWLRPNPQAGDNPDPTEGYWDMEKVGSRGMPTPGVAVLRLPPVDMRDLLTPAANSN